MFKAIAKFFRSRTDEIQISKYKRNSYLVRSKVAIKHEEALLSKGYFEITSDTIRFLDNGSYKNIASYTNIELQDFKTGVPTGYVLFLKTYGVELIKSNYDWLREHLPEMDPDEEDFQDKVATEVLIAQLIKEMEDNRK